MSRTRVGYDFRPVPDDIAPEWIRLPYQTRMLGVSLWLLGRGEPIPVPAEGWAVYLLGKLEVNGPDRPNLTRALKRLQELGLLVVRDSSATCLLRVCQVSAARPNPVCDVSAERKAAKSIDSHFAERGEEREERESSRERARESSARFEKPPLPAPPPELPPPVHEPTSWLRVWQLYAAHRGLDPLQLGHPSRQREALTAVAAAAEVEAGGAQGDAFDRAVRRLLGAWSSDKWVKEKQPTIANLAANLHRYARAKIAKVVPLQPEDIRHKSFSDAELLALDPMLECDLDYPTKMRRWELQARAERAERKAGAAE